MAEYTVTQTSYQHTVMVDEQLKSLEVKLCFDTALPKKLVSYYKK